MLLSAIILFGSAVENSANFSSDPVDAKPAIVADQFAGRKEANIPFAGQLDNFKITREGNEDILYLKAGMHQWYRAPLTCFGMGDPQNAMAIAPVGITTGIDKFTRFRLGSLGNREVNECHISSLIELTPPEMLQFKLESQKTIDAMLARKKP